MCLTFLVSLEICGYKDLCAVLPKNAPGMAVDVGMAGSCGGTKTIALSKQFPPHLEWHLIRGIDEFYRQRGFGMMDAVQRGSERMRAWRGKLRASDSIWVLRVCVTGERHQRWKVQCLMLAVLNKCIGALQASISQLPSIEFLFLISL